MKAFKFFGVLLAAMFAGGCAGTATTQNTETETTETENIEEMTDTVVTEGDVLVNMSTTLGDVQLRLFGDTPKHRDNFVKLVKEGYYDGTLFHRVIRDFMIQGGDPDSKNAPAGKMLGEGDPGYTIEAEFIYPKHFHKRGALAAARTGDYVNPERRSSGSQFYIVTGQIFNPHTLSRAASRVPGGKFTEEQIKAYTTVGGAPHLDGQYTVFGEVTKGMDVVDKIQMVATDANDRPEEDVRVIKMTLAE